MGASLPDHLLAVHLDRDHGWNLPYTNRAKSREQHDWEHRWGVPVPESNGPWSIYLDSGPQPPTVWD